ncbi:hypothetical protein AAVH_06710 [Aphelenchoides avenae]|nr:hypothetical protein AAVH_32006 [Aphelenchus avenae]KAH7725867.1 hypothetical protein AAVH_06710 [Aphelenchus avenae]
MQNVPFKEFALIRESSDAIGRPLWLALMQKALNTGFRVNVVLLTELERDLRRTLSGRDNGLTVIQHLRSSTIDEVRTVFDNVASSSSDEKTVVFFDNLNVLIDRFGIPGATQIVYTASRKCALFAKVQGDTLSQVDWRKLAYVASATLELKTYEDRTQLCTTTVLKKDGSRSEKTEKYVVSPSFSIESSAFRVDPLQEALKETLGNAEAKEPGLPSVPFDMGLNLKESERRAKANVRLPYLKAQSLVGLNISSGKKVRAGGQILYTPV